MQLVILQMMNCVPMLLIFLILSALFQLSLSGTFYLCGAFCNIVLIVFLGLSLTLMHMQLNHAC